MCLHDAHFIPSAQFLDFRFGLIRQHGFDEVDVWVLGYRAWKTALAPELPHLAAFLAGTE
jgi:hypothetical protein